MPDRYKAEITQKLIDTGEPGSTNFCPIAKAVKPHFPGCKVEVCPADEWWYPCVVVTRKVKGEYREVFKAPLPKKAIDFIDKYDEGKNVKPFSFVLRPSVVYCDEDRIAKCGVQD